MTTQYPIVPLSWLDGLNDLNGALEAYQRVLTAWIESSLREGPHADPRTFVRGLEVMFTPILEGYQDIHSQIDKAREMRLVGIASIAHPEEDHANR